MPLLLSKPISSESAYAVWNIQETLGSIKTLIDEPIPDNLNSQRLTEWIVGRILVKNLCIQFGVPYDGLGIGDTGKPFLNGHDAHISITHSFPMAAAMIHLNKSCGIDMARPRHKLFSVREKFINGREKKYMDSLYHICAVWCSKEVLYKIYGRKQLSLRDDTSINIKSPNLMIGSIHKPDFNEEYEIHYEEVKDFYLAYSL